MALFYPFNLIIIKLEFYKVHLELTSHRILRNPKQLNSIAFSRLKLQLSTNQEYLNEKINK